MDAYTMRGMSKGGKSAADKPAQSSPSSVGQTRQRPASGGGRRDLTREAESPRLCVEAVALPSESDGLSRGPAAAAGETVLVVDDNDLVRKLAVRLLDRFGYKVREAASMTEALSRLDGVQLLMTDLLLPGGPPGTELAKEARRRNADMAVLLTTGECLPASLGREGGYSMLYKPYTMQQLLQAVRNALAVRVAHPAPVE